MFTNLIRCNKTVSLLIWACVVNSIMNLCCTMDHGIGEWKEKQITSDSYGHFLNPVQAWSPDGMWLVYDTRNKDANIGRTSTIERVHVNTNEKDLVYRIDHQTVHGPGVGAAAWSPVSDQVIFIHGLKNASKARPYSITRRTGMGVLLNQDKEVVQYDGRDVIKPFTMGALRGGTHAHSWSNDGKWISFTYNDAVLEDLSRSDSSVQDLRMVGVLTPWGSVKVDQVDHQENFSGRMFGMVISRVTEFPEPGSDEISKAYEDGWIGQNGYTDESGKKHPYAVAFLGDVIDENGSVVTEVFVVDLPDKKPDLSDEIQLKGTEFSRPKPLSKLHQRRVTHTTERKYPGIQGPRQWMKSSPDGSELYFMMKDDRGVIQLFSVPTTGGAVRQISANDFSVDTAFDIDPTGEFAAYGADEKVYITSLKSGITTCLTEQIDKTFSGLRAIQWSYSGNTLGYNRKVITGDSSYYQVFTLSKNEN